VEAGIVSSLARPGGNLTGLDMFAEELDVKRLGLLKEMLPNVMQVAVPGIRELRWPPRRAAGRGGVAGGGNVPDRREPIVKVKQLPTIPPPC